MQQIINQSKLKVFIDFLMKKSLISSIKGVLGKIGAYNSRNKYKILRFFKINYFKSFYSFCKNLIFITGGYNQIHLIYFEL